jgi:dTDP-4-dehydrorhamnose 3,5-epimerase
MQVTPLAIPGVALITPRRFGDERGWFMESYRADVVDQLNEGRPFIQDNHVYSETCGTLRGLHFQREPWAQAKLVRVLRGAVYDVVVDIRAESPTRGQWVGVELTAESSLSLLVPRGFAHGYLTLVDNCEVLYKVDAPYAPDAEGGLCWNDPSLNFIWPLRDQPFKVKPKDLSWPAFGREIF